MLGITPKKATVQLWFWRSMVSARRWQYGKIHIRVHLPNTRYGHCDHVTRYETLRTYRDLKNFLYFESYLDLYLPSPTIKLFTKLRGGMLRIESNEGRWSQINYHERICKLCNSGSVEDENHILFHCRVWTVYINFLFTVYLKRKISNRYVHRTIRI